MAISPLPKAPPHIASAISSAARQTGLDFEYLLKTAARESSFDASAQAAGSSAQGLYQFIESTWLETVKEEGGRFGLAAHATKISLRPDGSYEVTDADTRRAILDLRKDPRIAALMAAAHTKKNADQLQEKLERAPTQGELYLAHFLGTRNAGRMIELQRTSPHAAAEAAFPAAAKANPAIFNGTHGPRSVSEVYSIIVGGYDKTRTPGKPLSPHENPIDKAGSGGPLISMAPRAPINSLFATEDTSFEKTDLVWATLFRSPGKKSVGGAPFGIATPDPLEWAAGRHLDQNRDEKRQPKHARDAGKVEPTRHASNANIEWVELGYSPGRKKDSKV